MTSTVQIIVYIYTFTSIHTYTCHNLYKNGEVGQEQKVKRDILITDHTATAKVVLWEEHVDTLRVGKSFKNFHIKEF